MNIPIHWDYRAEGDETLTVELGSLPEGYVSGSPFSVEVTIRNKPREGAPPRGGEDPGDDPRRRRPRRRQSRRRPGRRPAATIRAATIRAAAVAAAAVRGGDDPDDRGRRRPGAARVRAAAVQANRAPETAAEIAAPTLRAGKALEIDLSDAFDDPDGDALTYEAESSDESVATVGVEGDTLTVRGTGRGTAEITATRRGRRREGRPRRRSRSP